MRVSRILCTMLLFGSLAVEANEATAPKGTAADSATAAVASRPAATPSHPVTTSSRPATTQQIGRANADRLRSLLGTQARGRVVRQPVSRPVGSARAPTLMGGAGQQRPGANVTQFGATPARQLMRGVVSPAPVASPRAARPVPTLSALAIHSTNGQPRAPGLAVVGGPVVGHGAHNSSIDGTTRLRQKF